MHYFSIHKLAAECSLAIYCKLCSVVYLISQLTQKHFSCRILKSSSLCHTEFCVASTNHVSLPRDQILSFKYENVLSPCVVIKVLFEPLTPNCLLEMVFWITRSPPSYALFSVDYWQPTVCSYDYPQTGECFR